MVRFTPLRGTIFMTRSTFKSSSVFLGLLMVLPVFCLTVAPTRVEAGGQAQTTPLDEEGFEPLCNGKDLTGWAKEGNAGFEVKDGMIVCNGSGNWPTWLRTEEVFENFVLRLEYKTFYGAESGIFFHAPLHGRLSRVGFEVQICNNTGKPRAHSPGAIFSAVPP